MACIGSGKRKQITKQDAAATQLANKSASGDLRAGKLAFDLAIKAEDREAATPPPEQITAADEAIVARLIERLRLLTGEAHHEACEPS